LCVSPREILWSSGRWRDMVRALSVLLSCNMCSVFLCLVFLVKEMCPEPNWLVLAKKYIFLFGRLCVGDWTIVQHGFVVADRNPIRPGERHPADRILLYCIDCPETMETIGKMQEISIEIKYMP
jgi:hypothetical protein